MDDLVQEQGMGSLPTGFGNLDAVYATGEALRDALGGQSMTTKPRTDFNQPVLPLIRAKAMNPPAKRMTDQEIDEITEGLEKLQILQAVTERAFQRVTTANVNAGSYFSTEEIDESIAEVNYGGFHGQPLYPGRARKDFRDDSTCKWCRDIQVEGMRPQGPHKYMNQYHDYKMFIGKGVIHESDDNNYNCLRPWNPNKPAMPVQFSNDTPRRNQIIQRTINTNNNTLLYTTIQALVYTYISLPDSLYI